MADHLSARQEPLRGRAVKLLASCFANDDERSRRALLNLAFSDFARPPAFDCTGAAPVFADHVVGVLLAYGCAVRGRHSLSLLLETLIAERGRQLDPEFAELPRLLDADCGLPTRTEELAYLARLLADIRAKARKYSAIQAVGALNPARTGEEALDADLDEADIALLRLQRTVERESRDFEDILQAFEEVQTAALLGAPGSGKSTTLRRLAADLARKGQSDPAAPLPLFVALGEWTGDEPLDTFIGAHIPEIGWALNGLTRAGRLVLLLDGLNEVPTTKRKAKAEDVKALINRLTSALSESGGVPADDSLRKAQIIVSCRRDDYRDELDLGLDTLLLQPLTPRRVRAALHQSVTDRGESPEDAERLFWQLAGDEALAAVFAAWERAGRSEDAFWAVADPYSEDNLPADIDWSGRWIWSRCLQDPRSLLRLAASPFMLNMLYQVWRAEGAVPRNRGDLFARFIDRLLAREHLVVKQSKTGNWERTADGERLLAGLTKVAWGMQRERVERDPEEAEDFGVLTMLSRDAAAALLGGEDGLRRAEDATVLEVTSGVRFRHQLLQEYFTASALRQHIDHEGLRAARLWPAERWWQRSGWEEAAVLYAGLYAKDCTPVIRWLKDAQPEVAAQCILESGAEIADRVSLLRELHDAWLPRLTDIEGEPMPEARAAIGRALGRLGLDDRKGVGLGSDGLPDIDWVQIAGGEFLYQEGERRTCEPFRISRYPITHAQFQAFLDADDGYTDDRWWTGFDNPVREPAEARWPIANHPRETVSWFEAIAFCGWLTTRSRESGLIGAHEEIRLPTEWEWERAARGTDGRLYPWGDNYHSGYANIDEAVGDVGPHVLNQTSPVGIYPQIASHEGLCDMAGSVWEWCLNEYHKPDQISRGGSEFRVLRGGCWLDYKGNARADCRAYLLPLNQYDRDGFRVLCGVPIR